MKRAVVTRPAAEAERWVSALERQGWQAQALPLIEIAPAPDPLPLRRVRAHLREFDALMFVSASAVEGFFADPPWPAPPDALPRCWAPGPATARALRAAGVPASAIDQPAAEAANYDSESLWREVGVQVGAGHRLLIVRGQSGTRVITAQGNGRDWLAQQCRERGGQVDCCVAYCRRLPGWSEGERERARAAAGDGSIWLLSSSEALDNLRALLPRTDWSRARALATHPRIARAAAALGFGRVLQSRPALPDVLLHLESMP